MAGVAGREEEEDDKWSHSDGQLKENPSLITWLHSTGIKVSWSHCRNVVRAPWGLFCFKLRNRVRGKRQSRDGDPLVKKENVYEEDRGTWYRRNKDESEANGGSVLSLAMEKISLTIQPLSCDQGGMQFLHRPRVGVQGGRGVGGR